VGFINALKTFYNGKLVDAQKTTTNRGGKALEHCSTDEQAARGSKRPAGPKENCASASHKLRPQRDRGGP